MSDFPVFVVSLKDNTERRASITQECSRFGLIPQWIDAVDFRQKTQEEAFEHYLPTERALRKKRFLTAPEIGCTLSHRKIYHTMLERNLSAALVLEDDALFLADLRPVLENWQKSIIQMFQKSLMLQKSLRKHKKHMRFYQIPTKEVNMTNMVMQHSTK